MTLDLSEKEIACAVLGALKSSLAESGEGSAPAPGEPVPSVPPVLTDGAPLRYGALSKTFTAFRRERSVRVTVGTAGKVFSAAPDSPEGSLAKRIDHTLLKAEAAESDIRMLCAEARQFGFAAVCVQPVYVRLAARELIGGGVAVCSVAGFPLGTSTTAAKVFEAREAVANGASEIDVVIHVGALKMGRHSQVLAELRALRQATEGQVLKVILETALLSQEEKAAGAGLCREAGADFVKTSTGFSHGGATVEDVRLLRRTVGPKMGIKAAGGIRDLESALDLIAAGATRIGTSHAAAILRRQILRSV